MEPVLSGHPVLNGQLTIPYSRLRNKILLDLKQELIGGGSHEALADNDVLLPPTLPNPRVEFPRKASSDQNPADLRAQMMKELSRRVSSVLTDE